MKNIITKTLLSSLIEIRSNKHLLFQTVRQKLVLKYRRTVLGYLWTLMNPLCMMTITAIVFSALYNVDFNSFAIYMYSGMIVFNLFSQSIINSSNAYLENQHLITKIYIPRIIFPLSTLITILIDNILMALSLSIIMFLMGAKISLSLFFIPIAYVFLFFLCLGFSLVATISTVYLRDLQHIINLFMQALLFLTPVFIKPEQLFGKVKLLYKFNPISYYIKLFREPFLDAKLPDLEVITFCFIFSIFVFLTGFAIFDKFKEKAVFRL